MVDSKRWSKAQDYEKSYWKGIADQIAKDAGKQLTWYSWKATEFEKKLARAEVGHADGERVLEVGSGPIGIVTFIGWGEKYALDPLSDFYAENPLLIDARNSSVRYLKGQGERIPFADGHFSKVIIDNVLDHVRAPGVVLDEIRRVLSDKGHLYLELNIHTGWGYQLHRLLSRLNIDKGHPHSFTATRIREVLAQHGFAIKAEFVNNYLEARSADRKSPAVRCRVKGYTGLSEFIFAAVCAKQV